MTNTQFVFFVGIVVVMYVSFMSWLVMQHLQDDEPGIDELINKTKEFKLATIKRMNQAAEKHQQSVVKTDEFIW